MSLFFKLLCCWGADVCVLAVNRLAQVCHPKGPWSYEQLNKQHKGDMACLAHKASACWHHNTPCVCTYWQCHKAEAHQIQPPLQSGVIFHFRILARGKRILTHLTHPWHLGIGMWSGVEQWGAPFQGSGDRKYATSTAIIYCQSSRVQKPARETGKCQICLWNNLLATWTWLSSFDCLLCLSYAPSFLL